MTARRHSWGDLDRDVRSSDDLQRPTAEEPLPQRESLPAIKLHFDMSKSFVDAVFEVSKKRARKQPIS